MGFAAERIAVDVEGDVPWRVRERVVSAIEPDAAFGGAVLVEVEAPVAFAEEFWFADWLDAAGGEERTGVALAEGLELFVGVEEVEGEVGEIGLGVDVEFRFQFCAGDLAADVVVELLAEGWEVVAVDGDPCGGFVASAGDEEWAAGVERGDEGEPFDAAAAAFADAVFVDGDDEDGAVVAAHEAGGDDADDAWVPAFGGDDESGGVVFGGEAVGEFLGFVLNAVFDVLAFAVLAV